MDGVVMISIEDARVISSALKYLEKTNLTLTIQEVVRVERLIKDIDRKIKNYDDDNDNEIGS